MLRFLAKNWWALELSGAVMILSGVFALFLPLLGLLVPEFGLEVLVKLFGIYILAEGFILLAVSFKSESTQDKWITLIQGIAGIGTGIAAFAWPGMTATALLLIIAAWAIVRGILEIVGAIRLWEEIRAEWLMILSGILSLGICLCPSFESRGRRIGVRLGNRVICNYYRLSPDGAGDKGPQDYSFAILSQVYACVNKWCRSRRLMIQFRKPELSDQGKVLVGGGQS